MLGLRKVQTCHCKRALGSVPIHVGFVTNNVVMDTAGLPVAVSPLLPTDLIKSWCIIRPLLGLCTSTTEK